MKKKKSKRIKPSKENLIEFSREHLYYEIWMLFQVTELIKSALQGTPLCNALLESFVIHSAILIEFFYDRSRHPDTARASDYFKNTSKWDEMMPPYERYFDSIRERRNTELAHLSYKRLHVNPENKGWNVSIIELQLRTIVNQFLENADPQLIHPQLLELKTIFTKLEMNV